MHLLKTKCSHVKSSPIQMIIYLFGGMGVEMTKYTTQSKIIVLQITTNKFEQG